MTKQEKRELRNKLALTINEKPSKLNGLVIISVIDQICSNPRNYVEKYGFQALQDKF